MAFYAEPGNGTVIDALGRLIHVPVGVGAAGSRSSSTSPTASGRLASRPR